MIFKTLKERCVFFVLMMIIPSCTEPVDFDQVKDYQFTPVIESSLVFFDEPAPSFLDEGDEIEVIQDFILIDFFNGDFIVDNLIRAQFNFESKNSISRQFELRIDMFDAASQLQHTFTVIQEASPDGSEVSSSYVEVFEGESLQALKNTSIILFTLKMLPGAPIDEDTLGRIELKSKAVLYFNIEDTL